MNFSEKNHTFAVCAYQENPYLENCILSILNQNILGKIIISTSTPNQYILRLGEKYSIPVVINPNDISAPDNWNFAYSKADTEFVTICHQDDYYEPNYLEAVLQAANKSKNMILLFTDYLEDRDGMIIDRNLLLQIKRILNYPLQIKSLQKNKWVRRRILSLGNPICCPSVMFQKNKLPSQPFNTIFKSSVDWKSWIDLAQLDGEFVYCPQKLVKHRIWEGNLTSTTIANQIRSEEDYKILCSLWPEPLAKIIFNFYKKSQNSNKQSG